MKRILDSEKKNMTGQLIKSAREKKGFSQKELSEQLELVAVYVCRGSISRIEAGLRIVTDIEINAIAKVLDKPITYFFGKDQETE